VPRESLLNTKRVRVGESKIAVPLIDRVRGVGEVDSIISIAHEVTDCLLEGHGQRKTRQKLPTRFPLLPERFCGHISLLIGPLQA
jgi:hypothetical protein